MIEGKTVLGVIPARGGSKRFPGKNIASFRGKPLLVWTIEAALKSQYIDTLICSSDDLDIQILALFHGCKTLHRPAALATDEAKSEDVLRYVLQLYPADYVVLLQPTSPLRTTEDIDNCILVANTHRKAVVSYGENGRNGAVYVAPSQNVDFSAHITYPMPEERSLDIDYKEQCSPTAS